LALNLESDETAGSVKLNSAGIVMVLRLEKGQPQAAKPASATGAAADTVRGAPAIFW
jgi:hypothetical protein